MLAPFNDIYIFEVEVTSQNLFAAKNFLNILSSFELSQLNKFKTYDDYAVYLVSHVILRMLISKYTSIKADKIIYGYNKNGKPFLFSKIKNFKFNLSHSTERILIGFYNKEIGVDIEYKKELENYNDLAHYVFSEEEKSYINHYNQKEKFYELWTKKEALVKAIGIGLTNKIKDFSTAIKNKFQYANTIWQIVTIHVNSPNYAAHVAYNNSDKEKMNYSFINHILHLDR